MVVKRACIFLVRTSVLILLTFGLVFLISLIFSSNIFNTMFLFGVLLIGIVAFSFLDETMLISSSSCGKRMSMSLDIYNNTKNTEIETSRKKTRFATLRLYILMYLGPNRINVFISGVVILITCFLYGA